MYVQYGGTGTSLGVSRSGDQIHLPLGQQRTSRAHVYMIMIINDDETVPSPGGCSGETARGPIQSSFRFLHCPPGDGEAEKAISSWDPIGDFSGGCANFQQTFSDLLQQMTEKCKVVKCQPRHFRRLFWSRLLHFSTFLRQKPPNTVQDVYFDRFSSLDVNLSVVWTSMSQTKSARSVARFLHD
jgi:hypothetical protein